MLHQDSPTSNVLAFSIISNNSKSICSAHSEWSWCNSHSLWTLCWDAIIMEKIHKTCAIFERMKKQNNPSSWILCSTIILMLDCEQFLEWLMVSNKTICWPVYNYSLMWEEEGGYARRRYALSKPPFHLFNYHGFHVPPNLISFLNDKWIHEELQLKIRRGPIIIHTSCGVP